jgi:solute carrier family 45 protein 1/2/4
MEKISQSLDVLQIKTLTLRRAWVFSHIAFAVLMVLTFFIHSTLGATLLVGAIGIPWCITNWAPFAIISSEISKRDAIRRGIIRPTDRESQLIAAGEDDASGTGADSAGVVLGIHNVAIAAPQVIATLVSAIMFKLLQKPRGVAGDDSVAWVLRFGGLCALVAAYLTLRVHEEKDEEVDEPIRRRLD